MAVGLSLVATMAVLLAEERVVEAAVTTIH
jgi:hypothetical protein